MILGLPLLIVSLLTGKQRGEPTGMAIAGSVLNCVPLTINIIIILIFTGSFLGLLAGALGSLAGGF